MTFENGLFGELYDGGELGDNEVEGESGGYPQRRAGRNRAPGQWNAQAGRAGQSQRSVGRSTARQPSAYASTRASTWNTRSAGYGGQKAYPTQASQLKNYSRPYANSGIQSPYGSKWGGAGTGQFGSAASSYGTGGGWGSSGGSGKWGYGQFNNPSWRRWGWMGSAGGGSAADPSMSSTSITNAQSCLAQIIGSWVPQNGRMGPATRRALRVFQKRQGLPPSGLLDRATMKAIRRSCAGGGAASQAGGPPDAGQANEPPAGPPPGPPPQQAGPPPAEAPPEPAAPPEAAAPPDAGPPEPSGDGPPPPAEGDGPPEGAPDTGVPDSPAGEIGNGYPSRYGGEQEFIVNGPCTLNVQMHAPVPISKWSQLRQLPNTAGVYIIYSGSQPWYVGVARNAVRDRFLHRAKALRDMNIPEQLLAERSVALVTLKGPAPSCAVTRKTAGTASVVRPVSVQDAALNIVEQFFIAKCKTKTANRGNHLSEAVRVAGSGPLTIIVHKSNGSSKPYSFSPKQV